MGNIHGPTIVTNGLVTYLDFANLKSYPESGTAATDLGRSGNNGALNGSPSFSSSGVGSIIFDGLNDYINCGSGSSLNLTSGFSVSVWMTASISETFYYIADKWTYGTGNHRQWSLDTAGVANTIRFIFSTNGQDSGQIVVSSAASSYSTGWHNVCGTYNGSVANLYMDGVLVAGPSAGGGMVSTPTSNTLIGAGNVGDVGFFTGKLSQFSIFNRALSSDEILGNYNSMKSRFGL